MICSKNIPSPIYITLFLMKNFMLSNYFTQGLKQMEFKCVAERLAIGTIIAGENEQQIDIQFCKYAMGHGYQDYFGVFAKFNFIRGTRPGVG